MDIKGLEMPVLSHRWQLVLNSLDTGNFNLDTELVIKSVTKCDVDYKNKVLNIELVQGIGGNLHQTVYNLCNGNSFLLRVDALTGGANIYHSTVFHTCEILEHKCGYDYASAESLKHKLTVSFNSIELMEAQRQPVAELKR